VLREGAALNNCQDFSTDLSIDEEIVQVDLVLYINC